MSRKIMNFGDKLRIARKRKGLEQSELASLVGVSRNSISNWENGKVEIRKNHILVLCKILGVGKNYF